MTVFNFLFGAVCLLLTGGCGVLIYGHQLNMTTYRRETRRVGCISQSVLAAIALVLLYVAIRLL